MQSDHDQSPNKAAALAASFDLFNVPSGYLEAPHEWFRRLRDHDPVHDNADGSLLITRYDDVLGAWRDLTSVVDKRHQFCARFGEGPLFEHHTTAMLFRDPPDHDRLRSIVNPFFDIPSIERLRPAVVEITDGLLGTLPAGEPIDFVKDVAFRVTIAVICRMLGVPVQDGDRIQQLGKRILYPLNPRVSAQDIADGDAAVMDFKSYLAPYLDALRRQTSIDPFANIMSALIAAERGGAEISELEIVHMCIQALNGGHESTTNLLALSIHVLLENPGELKWLRSIGDNVSVPIEELLRFISPIQLQGRRTSRPIEIGGRRIPAETELVFGVGAANRDDRKFDDADSLNLRRRPNPHIGFGAGVHACIGRVLAKLETSIVLPAFLRRFRTLERSGAAEYAPSIRFRGLRRLPLRLYH